MSSKTPLELIIRVTVIASFVYIVVALYILGTKDVDEGFKKCICSRGTEQNCQDNELVDDLYRTGKLTENSKLVRYEPSSTNYPVVRNCSQMKPNWDFTDFGN